MINTLDIPFLLNPFPTLAPLSQNTCQRYILEESVLAPVKFGGLIYLSFAFLQTFGKPCTETTEITLP